jgi:hypothetical protein
MACRRCGIGTVVAIELAGENARPLTITSCNSCDHRAWVSGGEVLSRDEALALIPASRHGRATGRARQPV